MPVPDHVATIADGRLYFSASTCAQLFANCQAVALMAEGARWWLFPLHAGAGGLLLKQRNAAGDRAVDIRDFLRAQGLADDAMPLSLTLRHSAERSCYELVVDGRS